MRRPTAVAAAVAAGLLLGAAPAVAQTGPPASDVAGSRVVVVGAPGLRWDDVDPFSTPTLDRLARTSAVGVLSVRALPFTSCPADGWLTVGAGARAEAFGLCRTPPADEVDLEALADRNRATRDAAEVDALATALRDAGLCLAASGDGAQLAGGDSARACPVLLVEAPTVSGDDSGRAAAAAAVDTLVSDLDSARSEGSTLLVAGLSGAPGDDRAHLHVALATGPGFEAGGLRSASTRRTPYVQLVDLAPTVLDVLGLDVPRAMIGRPWRAVEADLSPADLADLDRRAVEARAAWVPFFVVLLAAVLLGAALALRSRSWRVAEGVGLGAVGALTGSYLAGLVPWWRAPVPLLALLGLSAAAGVAAAVLARRAPGVLGPATAVTAALAVVLGLDLLTGARLQVDAPAGYSPLVAGRFAGIGNVAFGVLATSALLALAGLSSGRSRRSALALVVGGGAVAVVLDGAPPFGSDVGGVLALVPGVVLLAMLRSGRRVTLLRLVAAGLGGAALVTLFALVDFSRPADRRTHLGRFVEQVRDGTAGSVVERKAAAIADLLLANAATALLPLVVAAAVWLVVRPPDPLREAFAQAPAWRHGLLAVGLVAAIGLVVNDSGPAVPAFALLVAVPATLAVCGRAAARRHQPVVDDG